MIGAKSHRLHLHLCPQITFLGEYSRRRVRVGCATTPETAVAIVMKTTRKQKQTNKRSVFECILLPSTLRGLWDMWIKSRNEPTREKGTDLNPGLTTKTNNAIENECGWAWQWLSWQILRGAVINWHDIGGKRKFGNTSQKLHECEFGGAALLDGSARCEALTRQELADCSWLHPDYTHSDPSIFNFDKTRMKFEILEILIRK